MNALAVAQERALREDAMVEQAQLIAEAEQLREQQKGSDERLETMLAKQEDRLLATHNRNDALKDAQHASTLTQALNTQSMRHTATRNQERALSGANHKQAMASATLRHNSEMDDQADAHTRDIERQALRMREENERSLAELQSRANRSNGMQEARFSQQLAAQAVEHAQDMATRDCEHFETRDREFREREAQHAAALASQVTFAFDDLGFLVIVHRSRTHLRTAFTHRRSVRCTIAGCVLWRD